MFTHRSAFALQGPSAYLAPKKTNTTASMLNFIKSLFRPRESVKGASVPDGTRVYAIGDIHGCFDLFEALADAIERDDAERGAADTTVILLGDLVDRGPDSRKVIESARRWQKSRKVRILAGNHEEMFLESFTDKGVLRHFLKHGGRETILSYGIPKKEYNDASIDSLQASLQELVPQEDRDFINGFEEWIAIGDYAFVHAGIAPGVPLEEQKRRDLLWIRERFLAHDEPHPQIIVHGHTIFKDIDERSNRIGVDTGAFRFGRLTAVVFEGHTRRYIQSVEQDGVIAIEHRDTLP